MEPASVVLYPSSGIGHLVSMVELGKLIHTHHPSLSVIILIIPTPYETSSTDIYVSTVSATVPSITFHRLPADALPPPDSISSEFIDLVFDIPTVYNPIVRKTLVTISEKSSIKAVVLDFFSNAAFEMCTTLDLPTYYFFTSGAFGLSVFLYLTTIHKTTTKNIKDLDVCFDIPGVPPVHASDMPPVLFDRDSSSYKNFLNTAANLAKSSGIIVNSFVGLEERAVGTIRVGKCVSGGLTPPVYLIGPLIGNGIHVDCNENECLKWLELQPSKSVLFLCFGSKGVFEKNQLMEIAIGLERSGLRFLWVVRDPPPDDENESTLDAKELGVDDILPEGFLARTQDRGLVVKNWAPQPSILSHASVGGFVTHCGWNSTLEAVVAGVPMVAWPLYAEQKMNRVYLVEELKVALKLKISTDEFVTSEALEEIVTELMQGEKGRAVKQRVLEMSERAMAAWEDGGSSRVEFSKLIRSWNDPLSIR